MIRSALLGIALLAGLIARGQDKAKESVGSVLQKHIKAIGGMGAHKRQKTRQMVGTFTLAMQPNAKPWKVVITQKAPNLKHTKLDIPERGIMTEGFDGKTAWRNDPGAGPKKLLGAELKQKQWEADFYAAVDFKKLYKRMIYEGTTPIKGKSCHVIKGIREDGKEVELFINTKTNLIDQMIVPTPNPQMPSFTMVLSDYRVVDGMKMAHKFSLENAGQAFMTMKIDKIKHGIKVDDALFKMPGQEDGDAVPLNANGRSPVLARFLGTWQNVTTNLQTGQTELSSIRNRRWTLGGNGKFLMEDEVAKGKEVSLLIHAYDPKANVYRSTYLGRNYVGSVTGTWNEKAKRMTWSFMDMNRNTGTGYHRFLDDDHAEWGLTIKDRTGKTIWNAVSKQKRIQPEDDATKDVRREPELGILGVLTGEWTSYLNDKQTRKDYRNTSNSRWSRKGAGVFLLTTERGVNGEKHTAMTWDARAKVYRGCFLEQAASGFIEGKYNRDTHMLEQSFYMFALPEDENGIIKSAQFADGIHGTVNIHFMERNWGRMKMVFELGDAMVQEYNGKIVRDGGKK